jgi:hypothetical protein
MKETEKVSGYPIMVNLVALFTGSQAMAALTCDEEEQPMISF